ncbi:MAG: RNA polymerase sigma factor [Rhodospirillaceae bacterium]
MTQQHSPKLEELQVRARWLEQHVLPHDAALRAWIQKKVPVGLDVDDVVQEAYAILASLDSVESIRNPKSYTLRVAYSVILSHVRRARIVPMMTVSDVDFLGASDDTPSVERTVSDRDDLRRVGDAISELPPTCRQVFVLRRIDGLSQREIAERLGITVKTVEKHITKAVRVLVDSFGRGGSGPGRASIGGQTNKAAAEDHVPAPNVSGHPDDNDTPGGT